MADAFGDDLFSAFDEDASSDRAVPVITSQEAVDSKDQADSDSGKRYAMYCLNINFGSH